MASREWVAKTVDTKGRPCPYRLAEPCPGSREGCAFWLDEILQQAGAEGRTAELQGGCGVLYQYVAIHEALLEQVRTQAAISQAAEEVFKAGQAMAAMVTPIKLLALSQGEDR